MSLQKSINQKSYLYFILFFILIIIAFWKTYLTRITDQENFRMHVHGIVLILWCIMLAIQPYLIKTKRNSAHKAVGKASYLLVPVLLFTTFDLLRYRINTMPAVDYAAVALVLNALLAFTIFYGLAIYYRHDSARHSRFMIATVFPFITPVTDRIIHIYFPSTLQFFPKLLGYPNVPLFGFILADIIVLMLSIWDWRAHKRLIFPFVLIVLLTYHYSFNYFYQYEFWQNISDWLMK